MCMFYFGNAAFWTPHVSWGLGVRNPWPDSISHDGLCCKKCNQTRFVGHSEVPGMRDLSYWTSTVPQELQYRFRLALNWLEMKQVNPFQQIKLLQFHFSNRKYKNFGKIRFLVENDSCLGTTLCMETNIPKKKKFTAQPNRNCRKKKLLCELRLLLWALV